MDSFDIDAFRALFPALTSSQTIYFDNGATTHKPEAVINAQNKFYRSQNANVHRSSHRLGAQSTSLFENARQQVAQFVNARSDKEIVWTKGTTESINLVASTWGEENISEGDEIVITQAEHHANIVPWQQLAIKKRAKLVVIPLNNKGTVDIEQAQYLISKKAKIVCCAHVSNVIGKVNPVEHLIKIAHDVGAKVLLDGAQAAASIEVNVQALDCDFYVFSAHKIYGPTGLGVLYAKEVLLEQMPPYQFGGEMIKSVSFEHTEFNDIPFRFEAGTPNISAVISLMPALDLIDRYQLNQNNRYKKQLLDYTYSALNRLPFVKMLVEGKPDIPLFSFTSNFPTKDLASALDAVNIAVRSGYMCAMPLMQHFDIDGCIRVALAPYNTIEEVDRLVKALQAYANDELKSTNSEEPALQKHLTSEEFAHEKMIKLFQTLKGWDTKHRQIMLFGKSFKRMDVQFRNEENLITGCESDAWLVANLDERNCVQFQADSQAKVIRGLLHIVFAAFQNKTPLEILQFDIEAYFTKLGLIEHLSPSRGNGLKAIVNKIKELAAKFNNEATNND